MKTYSPRKLPQNYHPLNHTTMPSNSRTHSYSNGPKPTCSTPLNIKPAKSLSKNTSKQEKSLLQKLPRPHPSSLSRRRKLGNYVPTKTISTSIAISSRMPIPFPSSLTLSTNYKDCQSSLNSMYNRDTIISSSNWRTDGRPSSPPH